MADGFHETPVRGKALHNAAPPAETAVATLPAVATNLDPTLTEGNMVALSTDLAGNLRVVISGADDADGTLVDVADRAGRILGYVTLDAATLTALESVDLNAATLTAITTALEAVSLNTDTITALDDITDDQTTALTTALTDLRDTLSTNLESVDLNQATRDDLVTRLTGALESVDLNTATLTALERTTPQVRGADVDDSNPLPVNIQTNPGTLVDSGLLTTPNVAPGADTTLTSDAVGAGVTGHLVEITVSSSVRVKAVLRANGVPVRVFFVDPTSSSLVYQPVDRDVHTVAATQVFDVVITNMDNLRTADVYASITHVEF